MHGLNTAAFHAMGGEDEAAPTAFLGAERPYSDRGLDQLARQRVNMMLGLPLYETLPTTEMQNLQYSSLMKALDSALYGQKRGQKSMEAARRR